MEAAVKAREEGGGKEGEERVREGPAGEEGETMGEEGVGEVGKWYRVE